MSPHSGHAAERSRPRRATRSLMESGELVSAPGLGGGELSLQDEPVLLAPTDASSMPQLVWVSVPCHFSRAVPALLHAGRTS